MIKGLSEIFFNLHYNIPFAKKLNRIYLGIFILPLVALTFFIVMSTTAMMKKQIFYAADTNFNQTRDYLEAYLSSYDTLAFNLSRIYEFQYLYQNRKHLNELSANDYYSIRSRLYTEIYTIISRSVAGDFSFYFDNELGRLANNETYFVFNDVSGEKWFSEMIEHFRRNRRPFLVCPPGWISQGKNPAVSFARTIFNRDNYWDLFGLVRVDMPLGSIIDILRKNVSVKGTASYILNYRQEIVASFNEDDRLSLNNILPYKKQSSSPNAMTVTIQGGDYMIWQASIGKYHLNLITIVPVSAISSQIYSLEVLLLASLLVLSLGAGYIFSREFSFLTERIQLVIKNMQTTNNGVLTSISRQPGRDEAGQLIINYNQMVKNLKTIMEDNYRSNLELKNHELQILWEQINPHFLYNTLEMINWLSKNGQNDKVSLAVSTLALFYQAALSGGMQKIPLSRELEHVFTYINLQNMRFENVLNYKCSAEINCDALLVPRMILQPIVENSIIHGILEKESGMGAITITISSEKQLLIISIDDDGIGIPEEMLAALNANNTETPGKGYGVNNVAKRIRLMYGASYGLCFTSQYGRGTRVRIRLPLDTAGSAEQQRE